MLMGDFHFVRRLEERLPLLIPTGYICVCNDLLGFRPVSITTHESNSTLEYETPKLLLREAKSRERESRNFLIKHWFCTPRHSFKHTSAPQSLFLCLLLCLRSWAPLEEVHMSLFQGVEAGGLPIMPCAVAYDPSTLKTHFTSSRSRSTLLSENASIAWPLIAPVFDALIGRNDQQQRIRNPLTAAFINGTILLFDTEDNRNRLQQFIRSRPEEDKYTAGEGAAAQCTAQTHPNAATTTSRADSRNRTSGAGTSRTTGLDTGLAATTAGDSGLVAILRAGSGLTGDHLASGLWTDWRPSYERALD
ncbi:hypothetical protein IRJ41_011670 [Triplophysa rosa]|uniref:Uncharacterized protein n=1 Tax=Triplophysa rosa TaxID=992332 RepID=A0A9W7TUJ2_TRIRA|nr:hypothetical protein IRJ41_011670 [Triplophysa rosa]